MREGGPPGRPRRGPRIAVYDSPTQRRNRPATTLDESDWLEPRRRWRAGLPVEVSSVRPDLVGEPSSVTVHHPAMVGEPVDPGDADADR